MPQPPAGKKVPDGYVRAANIAAFLIPDGEMDELLLWPPNLFAFTSYLLSLTGSYQLAVSPPRKKAWPPTADEIRKWHSPDLIKAWLRRMVVGDGEEHPGDYTTPDGFEEAVEAYLGGFDCEQRVAEWLKTERWPQDANGRSLWIPMVQSSGAQWRANLIGYDAEKELAAAAAGDRRGALFDSILSHVPVTLLACWVNFKRLLADTGKDVSKLLCNRDEESCYDYEEERDEMWSVVQSLLSMHAIADEACVEWGLRSNKSNSKAQDFAHGLLREQGTMATIHSDRCRVLPKRHNPSVGITLRSLSSNLAFHRSAVEVTWRESASNPLTEKINQPAPQRLFMLLLPWPLLVRSESFMRLEDTANDMMPVEMNAETDNFFVYDPGDSLEERDILRRALQIAQREGELDMVVLPEAAISQIEVGIIEQAMLNNLNPKTKKPISVFITGVREAPRGANFHRNAVYCKTAALVPGGDVYEFPADERQSYKQYKHHRWRLNRSQILQYGLSHRLSKNINWWEGIKIGRRRVSFINIGEHLTICPLICEDLARQDPIADLIRAVGPSLVITILMDGPQRADRWSSRYASVLSEDPGSAVITLTSYGMVRRCSTPYREQSKVVALWSDGNGPTREIELESGASGILLTLDVRPNCEQVADGRIERTPTSRVELADVIQIYA